MIQVRQRARRAAALLGVLAAAGAGLMAAPVTASASSLAPTPAAAAQVTPDIVLPLTSVPPFPTDPALQQQEFPGLTEPRHKCDIIEHTAFITAPGSTNSVEAVNCADVFILPVGGSSGNQVYVQNEVYCQWASGPMKGHTTACSNISEQVGAGSSQGTAALPAQLCGVDIGHSACTSGRDTHAAFAFQYHPQNPVAACTIWGESLRVSVKIPITTHPVVSEEVLATNPATVTSATNAFGYCLDL